jgi:Radical SAM superfamily
MMRFPPRLSWDLTRVRIAQKLFGASNNPLVLRLDLSEFRAPTQGASSPGDNLSGQISSRDSQVLSRVRAITAPVVWIGGDSPLLHARIGHLAREIINCGRTVFVEMDSGLLRRRIHEFRPVSRLCLVLPLNNLEDAHDSRARHSGDFRATMESIGTAKLSGFHICIETTIFPDSDRSELMALANFISTLDVDGWIHKRPASAINDETPIQALQSARDLIPSRLWRVFSELLDSTPTAAQPSLENKRSANAMVHKIEKGLTRDPREAHEAREAREEGLRAL